MKKRNPFKQLGAAALSGALIFASFLSTPIQAASLIDESARGSIQIYKYDSTSAENDGIWSYNDDGTVTLSSDENLWPECTYENAGYIISSTGEYSQAASSLLSDYALSGVVFSYVYCGKVETYSYTSGGSTQIGLVYETDEELAKILGLSEQDAYDMMGNVAYPCGNEKLHYDSSQLSEALAELLASGNTEAKNALEAYALDNLTDNFEETDEYGHTEINNLELGLYLIVETYVPENVTVTTDPWFVTIPYSYTNTEHEISYSTWSYDIVCYPKNQTGNPTLDKLVRNAYGTVDYENEDAVNSYNTNYIKADEGSLDYENYISSRSEYSFSDTTTASAGDILDYILVSRLPKITSSATYLSEYTFADVLCEGITYNQDAIVAIYDNAEDAYLNNLSNAVVIMESASGDGEGIIYYYNEDYTEHTFTLSFTGDGLDIINAYSEYYLVVSYSATVNSDSSAVLGDNGNKNEVTLTWSRSNTSYYDTLEDISYVYTYAITISKYFSDGAGDFSNVHFYLYNVTDGYYVCADNINGGTYYVGEYNDELGENSIFFTPNSSGKLVIYGLEADEYELIEFSTDSGYNLLTDSIIININSSSRKIEAAVAGNSTTDKTALYVGEIERASALIDGLETQMQGNNAIVKLEVINTKTTVFPATGGYGTLIFTIAGCTLALGGIFVATRRGKKNKA